MPWLATQSAPIKGGRKSKAGMACGVAGRMWQMNGSGAGEWRWCAVLVLWWAWRDMASKQQCHVASDIGGMRWANRGGTQWGDS